MDSYWEGLSVEEMSLILQMSLKHFPRDQNFQDLPSLDIGFGKVVARSSSTSEAPKVDSSGASIPETKDDAALVLLTSEELTQLNAIKELARVGLQARDKLNDRKRFLSILQDLSRDSPKQTFYVKFFTRGRSTVTWCHRVSSWRGNNALRCPETFSMLPVSMGTSCRSVICLNLTPWYRVTQYPR